MSITITVLEDLRDSLPDLHPEKAGVIRAIDLLRSEEWTVPTSATAVGSALLVLDHARAEVADLKAGDEVFLSNGIPSRERCGNDSGYSLHTVASVDCVDRLCEVTTSQTQFRCSPRFSVYLVGHRREE